MPNLKLNLEIESIEDFLDALRDDMVDIRHVDTGWLDAAAYVDALANRLHEPVLGNDAALFLESVIHQADEVVGILMQMTLPGIQDAAADVESQAARLRGLLIAVKEGV